MLLSLVEVKTISPFLAVEDSLSVPTAEYMVAISEGDTFRVLLK